MILQITDIHLNGEYDGRFNVKEHFERILKETKGSNFKAVVLTGDLADNGSLDDYYYIFSKIIDNFGEDTPILALPGNHDNLANLYTAYDAYLSKGYTYKDSIKIRTYGGPSMEPGDRFTIMEIPGQGKLVAMDNSHNDVPHKALHKFMEVEGIPEKWDVLRSSCRYFLFLHKPMIKPYHRFMNQPQYSIDEDVAKTFLLGFQRLRFDSIFCGHYHCPSIVSWGDWEQYSAPSSQGQLDPFSKDCVPSGNYPGYALINLDNKIKAQFKFIPEEN